jgi:drug/metabolite transporter (DMT)-like permease
MVRALSARLPSLGLVGCVLAFIGYALFSIQDASTKWFVEIYAVWQVLFVRSLMTLSLALGRGGRGLVRRAVASPHRNLVVWRSVVLLTAWVGYYTAARDLQLAELVTYYFAGPLLAIALSGWLLKERVSLQRWIAAGIGFTGIVIACNPSIEGISPAAALAIAAAMVWGYSSILLRRISLKESTDIQLLCNSVVFVLASAGPAIYFWITPPFPVLAAMFALGIVGFGAQHFLFEGYRYGPPSLMAPFEYTTLLWSFIFSYAIWGDIPRVAVFIGAGCIVVSGLWIVITEWRAGRLAADLARNRP